MGAADLSRLIPDCRIEADGQPLALAEEARLTRVHVDLDAELFAQCVLTFHDPGLSLIDGTRFASGTRVAVKLGFGSKLERIFEGEVVALEPQFRRDVPPSLRVVCMEGLHRLALSQMTRAFNDVDDRQIATAIGREHGLAVDAAEGTREHVLQSNVSDAAFLRKRAQQHGQQLRLLDGKLVIGGPRADDSGVTLGPGDGLRRLKVKIKAGQQVSEVSVHGWDAAAKREIVGRAQPEGDAADGAREHGGDRTLSLSGEAAPRDVATAESMARGRLRRLAERFVTADVEMTGDARLVPGKLFTLDGLDAKLDGKYRVDRAAHVFDKRGYRLSLRAARVKKKDPPRVAAAPERAPDDPDQRLTNARWDRDGAHHGETARMRVDAEGLDGCDVYFLVEHQLGSAWEFYDEVCATVQGGGATAAISLEHPAVDEHYAQSGRDPAQVAGTRKLRFRCSLRESAQSRARRREGRAP